MRAIWFRHSWCPALAAVVTIGLVLSVHLRAIAPMTASDAIRTVLVSRIGPEAEVDVLTVDFRTGADGAGSYREARPDPSAVLGRPVRFTLVPVDGMPVVAIANVRVVVSHLVTTHALERNAMLAADDIRQVREELIGLPIRRPLTLLQVQGRRLLRPLPAGAVLMPTAVVVRRAIEPGDHVTVTAVSGDIEVTAAMVAADAGDAGDLIRVFNPTTHRDIRVRVVKEGQVEVNYAR